MQSQPQPQALTDATPGKDPGGVPPAGPLRLTPDLDFLQADILCNPYPLYRQLQREQPVFWSEQMDAWVMTRHEDVEGALRNPKLFSSARVEKIIYGYVDRRLRTVPMGAVLRPLFRKIALIKMDVVVEMATRFMWQRDPPDHTRLRKLMLQGFTGAMVTQVRPQIALRVRTLLDAVQDKGEMDFMADFAEPLPAMIVADIFGLPDHWEQLHRWENALKLFLGARRGNSSQAQKDAIESVKAMKEFFTEKIHERRAKPGDDLISRLAHAREDGFEFDDLELCANLMVTLGAAQVTTQDMLGNGLLALLRHPEQLAEVQAHRELVPKALEEIVRYDGPVQLTNRVLTEDTELRGVRMRRGQLVYLIRGAANRDPDAFEDPDRFDIHRENRKHVGYGAGIHYCIGATLARAEGELALYAVLDRLPNLRLADGENSVVWRADNLQFRGLRSLRLRFGN